MAKKPKKNFKIKIIRLFVLITLLPILIISASNLFFVVKTRQKSIAELQNLALENTIEKTTKFLNQKMEGFNLVISGAGHERASTTQSLSEIDPNNLIFLIKSVKETAGEIDRINFINKDGTTLMQIDNQDNILLRRYFSSEKNVVYTTGVTIRDSIQENSYNKQEFKTALSGDNYIGQTEIIGDKQIIKLASQIENQDRQIIGIITAEIDLVQIQNIIKGTRLGNSGFVYVVDKNGNVIASSNSLFATSGENLKNIEYVTSTIGGYVFNGLDKFQTKKNHLGDTVVLASSPIENVDWFVLSEWPRRDAFDVINNILILSLLITGITLLVIIVLGILFASQIIKPIRILSKGAQEIAKGNLDHKIVIKTNDEFELLANQFNEMIKVLKENERLKDEFVFISAHELRTPVTAIKGYLSMALDESFGIVPPEIKKFLDIVYKSNERLVQLVHDLLEVARGEAGKMKLDMRSLSIDQQISEVLVELNSLSQEKGIKIIYNKEKYNDVKVKADPFKLREVLVNLIGNAIKYTAQGGDIEIQHEIKGEYITTHIKDNGIGINQENVKKLFSKFFRVDSKDTEEITGTGLGLFICKEIVERMNGKIWVKSELGEGSVFSFKIPKG